MRQVIALFGEAEKGSWDKPHRVKELPELIDILGNPPPDSEGLFFAIQAVLYKRDVVYFRVQDEGFSKEDYFLGLKHLKNKDSFKELHAICMPGVGDTEILNVANHICEIHKTVLLISQKDLFDYLLIN
jgi:hypothetical protein